MRWQSRRGYGVHIANSLLTTDRAARFAAAEAAAIKALSLAPDHAFAHLALGAVYMFTNRAAQGIAECEHALALDRSLAAAHATKCSRIIGRIGVLFRRSLGTLALRIRRFSHQTRLVSQPKQIPLKSKAISH